ncbi:myelin regulatory factor-like isoform X2 [Pomacea canaliculata]|uniref:myelin regulatory factor-like isoform X2 n=1 Tax=Pomacea canaliculata TaxID=400727 RepID=UPI000D72A23F|nr:myelin regulatory factor-like isoform X2 [Pomacea canaliculata]
MDALAEDQALQAVLDRDIGIDNEALDFNIGFEDYINGADSICLPDDSIPAVAYTTGRLPGSDCALAEVKPCTSSADIHPQPLPHPYQHSHPHPQELQQQQLHHHHRQQPQPHHQQQALQHHHQQQTVHHHQQPPPPHPHQQPPPPPHLHHQQPAPHHQQHLPSTSSMYCGVNQSRLTFDTHHSLGQTHTPLPDSPPDSGSEPYSPQDATPQNSAESHLKHSMPSIPHALYSGPQHRPPHPGDMTMGPKMPPSYLGGPDPPKLNHIPQGPPPVPLGPSGLAHQVSPTMNHPFLPQHFSTMNNMVNQPTKKRKFSDSPTNTINASMIPPNMSSILSIKQEPPAVNQFSQYIGDCGADDDYSYDVDSNSSFMEGAYQVIKWQHFNTTTWNTLTDSNFKDVPSPTYRVDADKGFNYSIPDEAFVCQKKNHFQVTVHIGLQGHSKYVRTPDGIKKIEDFFVHFYGVKMESPTQVIKIEQSQSDRSKRPFYPVRVDLSPEQVVKFTVGRLHFSETTSNNMRKKGKPNPDQRYFRLVVALHAHSGQQSYLICASSSERIIVRASNPGQFDSEMDVLWQKGHTGESVYHVGRVGINTDHPEESLTVHGNMRLTGHLLQPSDMRAKENLQEIDSKDQLENVQKLRFYRYDYSEDYAVHAGIPLDDRGDSGVIAQEILDVLPDAVKSTGDIHLPNGRTLENFLVVNKDRIFMENVGAVKELCKLTDNLEVRIDELEKMNKKLSKLRRYDSIKSTISTKSISSISTLSSNATGPPKQQANRSSSSDRCGKSNKHSHRHHHQRSSSGSSSSLVPAMCGNRFIQITIIILILIMAFCLVAITTLYILERHKQTSHPHALLATPAEYVTRTPTQDQSTTGSTTSVTNTSVQDIGHSSLSHQNSSSTSASTHSSTHSTISSTTTSKKSEDKTTHGTTSIDPAVSGNQRLPAYPVCDKGHCELQCCPPPQYDMPSGEPIVIPLGNRQSYNTITHDGNESGGDEDLVGQPFASQNSVDHGNSEMQTQETSSHNAFNMGPQNTENPHFQVIIAGSGRPGPPYNAYGGKGGPIYHYIYKRQASASSDEDEIVLVVKELNFTVTNSFCLSPCTGLNRSYFIQLHQFFGFMPITLQFRMRGEHRVTLCNTQPSGQCPGVQNPSLEQNETKTGSIVEWLLNVGINFQTIYNFRITEGQGILDNNTAEECSLQPAEGRTIRTFSLKFQRFCPSDNVE